MNSGILYPRNGLAHAQPVGLTLSSEAHALGLYWVFIPLYCFHLQIPLAENLSNVGPLYVW